MAQVHLDRKTLLVLAVAVLVIALLVFLAGYLVGLNSALADPAEPGEPPSPVARQPAGEPAAEDDVPEIPVRSPQEPAEPEPETFSDEPVPLDDSDPPLQEPPREPPRRAREAPADGDFTIQLGAFREEDHAEDLRAELLDLGLEPEVLRLDDPVLGVLYKVRVGRYATFDDAKDVAGQIRDQVGHDAWAVRVKE